MPMVNVTVVALGDQPPLEVSKKTFAGEGQLSHFFVLEKGTVEGKTSVAFLVSLPDGKEAIVQTTAAIMDGMWHAMKGAMQRFGDSSLG